MVKSCIFAHNPTRSDGRAVQVLETYLPGAVAADSLLAARLDASSVEGSDCVADWLVYHAAGTWVSTSVHFVESGETSDIVPEHLGVHHATKAVVTKLMADSDSGHRTHLGVRRH